MTSISPPLPKLHPAGAPVATHQEAKWWPLNNGWTQDGLQKMSNPQATEFHSEDQIRQAGVTRTNDVWVKAARAFLTNYITPVDDQRLALRSRGDDSLISAALTRIRDDKVVQASIVGIDQGTARGLDSSHRDVLSAVALLTRLDRTTNQLRFNPGDFEPYTECEPKTGPTKES